LFDVVAVALLLVPVVADELDVVADESEAVADEPVAVDVTPSVEALTPGGNFVVVSPVDFFAVLLEPHEASPTVEKASSSSMHAASPIRLKRLPFILMLPSLPPRNRVSASGAISRPGAPGLATRARRTDVPFGIDYCLLGLREYEGDSPLVLIKEEAG